MNKSKWFIFSFLTTLLIVSSVPLSLYLATPDVPETSEPTELDAALSKFVSYEELQTFLKTSTGGLYMVDARGTALESNDAWTFSGAPEPEPTPQPEPTPSAPVESSETQTTEYSQTNIQVGGVDEADIVKTDGEYIYIVSGGNVTIVKAYPPEEAKVVSRISLDGSIMGIFINRDKLALFHNDYTPYVFYDGVRGIESVSVEPAPVNDAVVDDEPGVPGSTNSSDPEAPVPSPPDEPNQLIQTIVWEPPTTSVKIYDVSNKENPLLTRDFSIDGDYFNSRMIGDYVYVVATMYSFYTETDVALPRIHIENETEVIPAKDIYYYNFTDTSYTFTTIVALNLNDDAQTPTHETIVLGGTSALFVSPNNIYLTFPDYPRQENDIMETTIQRIKIDKQSITFAATGEVPGHILNQFSMGEYNGYFRIATTTNNFNWGRFAEESTSKNNVYVLDMNLNVLGKLEDLAPGEHIYSVRFMGDRCYMVTFRNIDPLFVIDLSDPTAPAVLGELKVTGYSGYLHIYDENHLIGIGKETIYDEKEDFAWYQGVKISLFDVSDVTNPIEVAKYEIGDRGTDSPILYDHKSLLFDREKNLLVIPVLVAEIDENKFVGYDIDRAYGEPVWQGAYIFDISPDGIELRGKITHMDDDDLLNDGFYYYSGYTVQRTLFIENVLYTISSVKVKMNNLETLVELNTIEIA